MTLLSKRTGDDIWRNLYEFPLIETERAVTWEELSGMAVFQELFDGIEKVEITREYVALLDHKSAILGDAGINAKVPAGFWDSIMKNMIAKFKEGKITEGICEAVISAGEQLKVYFPYQADDVNELPDEISFQ